MFYNSNNWNLLANIVSKLHNMSEMEQKLREFKSLKTNIRKAMLSIIVNCLKECGFPRDTSDEVFERLEVSGSHYELCYFLMEALHYVDMKLIHQNETAIFMLEKEKTFSRMRELNTNREQVGVMILPRFHCRWSQKQTGEEIRDMSVSRGINELMQYYYYVDVKTLEPYCVQNYILRDVAIGEKIRIVASPVTNKNVLKVDRYSRDEKNKLAVEEVDGSEIVDRVVKVIDMSAELEAGILIFPEMLGTKEVKKCALTRLAELDLCGEEKHSPLMTLLPTEWLCNCKKPGDRPWRSGNNSNILSVVCANNVIDGENVRETFQQQKQTPYWEREENLSGCEEDIVSDRVISILHVPDIGRIAFPVCADLLSDHYRKILVEILGATLILCPSFSKGFNDFLQIANSELSYGCRIVWCNTCAVQHMYKGKSHRMFQEGDICCVGIGGDRDNKLIKPLPHCGKGECGEWCLFYIDIPLSVLDPEELKELKWKHLTA